MSLLHDTARLIAFANGASPLVQFPDALSIRKSLGDMKFEAIEDPDEEDMVIVHKPCDAVDLWWKLKPGHEFFGPVCKFRRTLPDAVIPGKTHGSDVGYDLTVVSLVKEEFAGGMRSRSRRLYDSGIQLEIPYGYYIEVVPRSSFSKTGWMLSNSVGIIDPSYRGNLLVSITQVLDDEHCLPIQLPFRGFQLIVRRQEHMRFVELDPLDVDALGQTARGDGGFGST
jgi:deoxyuridine 5'-triphosphate nucleotidohydrolase